jgi:hypothetical protein
VGRGENATPQWLSAARRTLGFLKKKMASHSIWNSAAVIVGSESVGLFYLGRVED